MFDASALSCVYFIMRPLYPAPEKLYYAPNDFTLNPNTSFRCESAERFNFGVQGR